MNEQTLGHNSTSPSQLSTPYKLIARLSSKSDLPALLLCSLIYYALANVSIQLFSSHPSNIALLWLPAGFAIFMHQRLGFKALFGIFVTSFTVNFSGLATESVGSQILHTAICAAADAVFAYLSVFFLNRRVAGEIDKPADLFTFILYSCFIPLSVSSTIIGTNLWLGGYLHSDEASFTAVSIFLADFLGILLIYPLFPAWERRHTEGSDVSGIWAIASLMSLGFIVGSFYFVTWMLYLALPALIYVVIGAKSLYAYISITASIVLYNLLSVHLMGLRFISDEWLSTLTFSCSITIATLAMSIQQRSLSAEQDLRRQWMTTANQDSLTKLPNRGHAHFLIEHEIARVKRHSGTFCVAMLDIDHFKLVNDNYGHNVGDAVLIEFSARLRDSFRESDIISRYGGEEFLLVLLETSMADCLRLMNKVREQIALKPFDVGEESIRISFSAGITQYQSGEGEDIDHLIERADMNLYAAKHQGRNRVVASTD